MDDSASTSSRSAEERKLRMKVSLQRVQTSFDQAVHIMEEELKALQGDYALLQSQHATLQKENKELKEEFESSKELWRKFKLWWKDKQQIKATQQTPSKGGTSSPNYNFQTPGPSSSTALNRNGKAKLSEADLMMLNKLGLETNAFHTPRLERKGSTSSIRVQKEPVNEGKEMHATPSEPLKARSDADANLHCEQRLESSKKRSRSSIDGDNMSSLSRRAFNDIGNRSVSDELIEEEDTSKVNDNSHSKTSENGSHNKQSNGRNSTGHLNGNTTSRTINQEYEVDIERNGNVPFLHKTVVRGKAERKRMHAYDCECCSEYYEAVGDVPLRKYEDPRRARRQLEAILGQGQRKGEGGDNDNDNDAETRIQLHRQHISRHRDYGLKPASTPPAYWDTAFPTTQRLGEINQLARQEHRKKWDQVARDPRLKKRV